MSAMKIPSRILAVVLLFFPLSVVPASDEVTDYDRFQLWNDCEPMDVIVGVSGGGAEEIGLKQEGIKLTAMSILNAAGLYDADKPYALLVWAYAMDEPFSRPFAINLRYLKPVYDPATELTMLAVTWQDDTYGRIYKRDAKFVLTTLMQEVDSFIDEYKQVNGDSCSAR